MTITPHIVVRDAARAAQWYANALGAQERGRIEVPGGKLMQVELALGDSTVVLADEFPDLDVLSPLSIGGTATALHLVVDDVDAVWQRAIDAARRSASRSETPSGASATGRSSIRSATAGAWRSTCATSRARRSSVRPRSSSAAEGAQPGWTGRPGRWF
jgi:uncharacterized glyoxalase superfamily protein PhnB